MEAVDTKHIFDDRNHFQPEFQSIDNWIIQTFKFTVNWKPTSTLMLLGDEQLIDISLIVAFYLYGFLSSYYENLFENLIQKFKRFLFLNSNV